jgi:hypothetical protein
MITPMARIGFVHGYQRLSIISRRFNQMNYVTVHDVLSADMPTGPASCRVADGVIAEFRHDRLRWLRTRPMPLLSCQ